MLSAATCCLHLTSLHAGKAEGHHAGFPGLAVGSHEIGGIATGRKAEQRIPRSCQGCQLP